MELIYSYLICGTVAADILDHSQQSEFALSNRHRELYESTQFFFTISQVIRIARFENS